MSISNKLTFGSVCSGIEAAQLAFKKFEFNQLWSSEIADFPSKVLEIHYPDVPNVGDMLNIPEKILSREIDAPDLFCGGTPCQAFSLAGWKNGLKDDRGQLTMTYIDIANAIDKIRESEGKKPAIILWENVEGVLTDKTNAFGNFISGLAGYDEPILQKKWPKSGFLHGKSRNVAWRVLDSKYFGLPQQRKRLYVLAGGKDFSPENSLIEFSEYNVDSKVKSPKRKKQSILPSLFEELTSNETELIFEKDGHKFQVFREYTDCLYSAYGTKWNGNAAAYNGSLYIAQNERLRRFTPLECERLMGMPDNYTLVNGNSHTNRFQAIGNSWAIPVVEWIASRIISQLQDQLENFNYSDFLQPTENNLKAPLYLVKGSIRTISNNYINGTDIPNIQSEFSIKNVVEATDIPEKFYLSSKACAGILRRKNERNMKMNPELEKILTRISQEDYILEELI